MRAGQQAGLERLDAVGERTFEVQRTDHAVLGGAERQVDHRHRHLAGLRRRVVAGRARPTLLAAAFGRGGRIAAVGAARDDAHRRQQRGQRAHGGRLAGAPVAEHQHAADARVDGGDHQRQLHLVLGDDRGKREHDGHARQLLRIGSALPAAGRGGF